LEQGERSGAAEFSVIEMAFRSPERARKKVVTGTFARYRFNVFAI
jgi:hypothetical protein